MTSHVAWLHADAISVDALVKLNKLKEECGGITSMGNLSTYMQEFGNPESVQRGTEQLLAGTVDILASA